MTDITKIREGMGVIDVDDSCIGLARRLEAPGKLRITCLSAGCGFDHLIPQIWVSRVDQYVCLDKTSHYIADHWENAAIPKPCTSLDELLAARPH